MVLLNLTKAWIDAAKILGENPDTKVQCPECNQSVLLVKDVDWEDDPKYFERIIYCPKCDAKNVMRKLK